MSRLTREFDRYYITLKDLVDKSIDSYSKLSGVKSVIDEGIRRMNAYDEVVSSLREILINPNLEDILDNYTSMNPDNKIKYDYLYYSVNLDELDGLGEDVVYEMQDELRDILYNSNDVSEIVDEVDSIVEDIFKSSDPEEIIITLDSAGLLENFSEESKELFKAIVKKPPHLLNYLNRRKTLPAEIINEVKSIVDVISKQKDLINRKREDSKELREFLKENKDSILSGIKSYIDKNEADSREIQESFDFLTNYYSLDNRGRLVELYSIKNPGEALLNLKSILYKSILKPGKTLDYNNKSMAVESKFKEIVVTLGNIDKLPLSKKISLKLPAPNDKFTNVRSFITYIRDIRKGEPSLDFSKLPDLEKMQKLNTLQKLVDNYYQSLIGRQAVIDDLRNIENNLNRVKEEKKEDKETVKKLEVVGGTLLSNLELLETTPIIPSNEKGRAENLIEGISESFTNMVNTLREVELLDEVLTNEVTFNPKTEEDNKKVNVSKLDIMPNLAKVIDPLKGYGLDNPRDNTIIRILRMVLDNPKSKYNPFDGKVEITEETVKSLEDFLSNSSSHLSVIDKLVKDNGSLDSSTFSFRIDYAINSDDKAKEKAIIYDVDFLQKPAQQLVDSLISLFENLKGFKDYYVSNIGEIPQGADDYAIMGPIDEFIEAMQKDLGYTGDTKKEDVFTDFFFKVILNIIVFYKKRLFDSASPSDLFLFPEDFYKRLKSDGINQPYLRQNVFNKILRKLKPVKVDVKLPEKEVETYLKVRLANIKIVIN